MTSYEPNITIENLLDLDVKAKSNKIVNKLFNILRSAYIFEKTEVIIWLAGQSMKQNLFFWRCIINSIG